MSGLELRQGKFYLDGKVVPPIFGDVEQIKLLKEAEDYAEKVKESGIPVDYEEEEITRMDVKISFLCTCGNKIKDEIQGEDYEDYSEDDFSKSKYTCKKCFANYMVDFEEYGSELVAKKI